MDWLSVVYTFCTLLFILGAVVLILVILVQKPQGGGLSAAFGAGGGASQTAFGAKTGDVLTLVTVGVFVFFLAISITMVLFTDSLFGQEVEQIAPVTPSGVAAVAKSPTSVQVTWVDESDNEESFLVQRSDDPAGQWFTVGGAEADEEEFLDEGVNAGQTYYYRIIAENQFGRSGETDYVDATTPEADEAPIEAPGDGEMAEPDTGGENQATEGEDENEGGGEPGDGGGADQPDEQSDSGNGG